LTEAYTEQIATARMSREEAELWRLAQQGATAEQLAQVAALQEQAAAAAQVVEEKERMRAADQALTAATQGTIEAAQRIDAYRQMLAESRPATTIAPNQPPQIVTTVANREEMARTEALLERIANAIEATEGIIVEEVRI
jgi:hypothetical protein